MKLRNSFFAALLTLLLLAVGAASASAQESGGVCGALNWTLTEDGTLTVRGTGAMPDYYDGWKTGVPIQTVVLEEGVTNVGKGAFSRCTSLRRVSLPSTLTEICADAFFSCENLQTIEIPNGVTAVGSCALKLCSSLTTVVFPDSVQTIGSDVCSYDTALRSVVIGSGVNSIGTWAFFACDRLEQVEIDAPGCAIHPSANTVPSHITLIAPQGSTAAQYAAANGNPFCLLTEETHVHTFLSAGSDATCTEDGVQMFTCTRCGVRETVVTPALGHIDDNVDHVCDRCGTQLCKFCGQTHDGVWSNIVQFFHNIFYFFRHLFQK